MFFNNREYGKLLKKESLNGSIIYTIENLKGKSRSISFDSDVCPTANIGDEVFFIYSKNAFSETKKGIFLSSDLKEATVFNNKFLSPASISFWKEFVGFTAGAIISITASIFSFAYGISFLLQALGIEHMGALGFLLFKTGLFVSASLPSFFMLKHFFKNMDTFVKLSQQRDKYFLPYKKENFSRKDIFLNKTLNEEEKTKFTIFVRNIEGLPSVEKLEIYNYIEEQKKMKVNEIGYMDILNISNKLKMKKKIEKLLLE